MNPACHLNDKLCSNLDLEHVTNLFSASLWSVCFRTVPRWYWFHGVCFCRGSNQSWRTPYHTVW